MKLKHLPKVTTIWNGVVIMKFVLVNKYDEIVDACEIASGVGVSGARTYFRKRKQLDEESFDKLWKVMSMERYDIIREASSRDNKQYEWWKEDKQITDDELKL